jgi:hypothetical protein
MRTHDAALYDNSLAGILTRLTHGILTDANDPAKESPAPAVAASAWQPSGVLDRLDAWFWKQEMKQREAFLSRSIDIFDLERRMRCLERGDRWLGTDSTAQ